MNKIDQWWVEGTTPVNLYSVGRINFSTQDFVPIDQSTLNKTLSREVLLEIMKNNDRMRDFYLVGPVQRAAVEDFVDEILNYVCKNKKV